MKKILIIRLSAIGDVVHSTIIPKAIKEKHPDWEIHYMTQNNIDEILKNQKYIDKVIAWDYEKRSSFKYTLETIKKLRKEKYDIIFNLTFALRNYFLAFGARPKKIAFKKINTGLWVDDYYNSAKAIIKDLEKPENLELFVPDNIKEKVQNDIKQYPKPYILISPGKFNNIRQGRIWDMEKWKKLCSLLKEKYHGTIFVNGSKCEKNYHKQLANENVMVLSGKYNLEESCALTSLMDLVISGDSGPCHMASALDVNVLALLGSTSPDKIKPYGKKGYYIEPSFKCRYCWKKKCKYLKEGEAYAPCIESINPDDVMKKIQDNNLIKLKEIQHDTK